MTEKILNSTSIASGGTTTAKLASDYDEDVVLRIDGDSNSTDIDVEATGVGIDATVDNTPDSYVVPHTTISATTIDATSGAGVVLSKLSPYERAELTFTNNAASSTTITVYAR